MSARIIAVIVSLVVDLTIVSAQADAFEAGATGTIKLHGRDSNVSAKAALWRAPYLLSQITFIMQPFIIHRCDQTGFEYRRVFRVFSIP